MRILRDVIAIYLGVLTLLYSFQTRVIFPGASTQGQPFAEVKPRPGTELVTLKAASGERVIALFGPAMTPDGRIDLNAASRPDHDLLLWECDVPLLRGIGTRSIPHRLGLNVLIPDYVGYGMSAGSPSEKGCQATADAAYDYLVSTRQVDSKTIISAGWSLGGAVAIDLASARRHVGGLDCFFFNIHERRRDGTRSMLPFIPVSLLLRHRFDSVHKIAKVRCPTLIGHGRRDSLIPFRMGEKLAASAGGPVTTLWIDLADHNDFFDVAGRRIDEAITEFVKACIRRGP